MHVIEYYWKFDFNYQLEVFAGAGGEPVRLIGRKGTVQLITSTESSPRPETRGTNDMLVELCEQKKLLPFIIISFVLGHGNNNFRMSVNDPISVNITWILQVQFAISKKIVLYLTCVRDKTARWRCQSREEKEEEKENDRRCRARRAKDRRFGVSA